MFPVYFWVLLHHWDSRRHRIVKTNKYWVIGQRAVTISKNTSLNFKGSACFSLWGRVDSKSSTFVLVRVLAHFYERKLSRDKHSRFCSQLACDGCFFCPSVKGRCCEMALMEAICSWQWKLIWRRGSCLCRPSSVRPALWLSLQLQKSIWKRLSVFVKAYWDFTLWLFLPCLMLTFRWDQCFGEIVRQCDVVSDVKVIWVFVTILYKSLRIYPTSGNTSRINMHQFLDHQRYSSLPQSNPRELLIIVMLIVSQMTPQRSTHLVFLLLPTWKF